MKVKELIKKLDSKRTYISGETKAEVKQKLMEYRELQLLLIEMIDSDAGVFEHLFECLEDDLEGGKIEYFQEELQKETEH